MKRKIILTALLFLFITTAQSQQTWQKLSGFNNANSAIWMATGNGLTYAITADRWIYYTDASVQVWEPFITVPDFYNVGSIKASQTTSRVFCLTSSSGLAYTDNFGQSWESTTVGSVNGQSGFSPLILAYGLHNTKIIASTIGPITGDIQNNLFISTNNGVSFAQIGTLNFYPTNFHFIDEDIVVSNSASGVFKTDNVNSGVWTLLGFEGLEVTDLEVNENVMYASVLEAAGNGNVYKTEDGGQNWTLLNGIPENSGVSKLAFDWENNRLFATTTSGVHAFINNNWTTVSPVDKAHEIITTANNSVVFGGVRVNGVHKISNSSLSVEQINEGLILPADYMVVSDDNQIYTASFRTAFLSKFNLDEPGWETFDLFEDLVSTNILALEKSPDGQCVIGGMHYIAQTENQGANINILASTQTAPLAPVYDILFPQKMFVGNNGSIAMLQHQVQTHIDYSPDMGNSWEVLFETVIGVSPGFLSVNKVCSGTQTHFILGLSNQTAQATVIASTDQGNSWTILPNAPETIRNIFIDKEDTLYVVSTASVFRWDATTQNWITLNINTGQTSPNKNVELAFDSQNKLHVLVRSTLTPFAEEGIYIPSDNQDEFIHVPFPTINGEQVPMKRLAFAGNDIPIMMTDVATNDPALTGFYYYSSESLLSTDNEVAKLNLKIYPNPASDEVYITGLENQTINGAIYSLTGQHISVKIQNGKIDIQNLSSGFYILNFDFEGNRYQFKIIVKK
ncbi:MAG: T9SS type A sorting domain-containing protein [Flavobacteriaceae bacterium]